ncbi:cuticle collagen 2-like [Sorex araneus]|uniref:cuticle collagen 2-like n=1 Tax=Sorex araneus TaxID=42254 RepID=UPI0024335868|nr:cuticle collagen 2-like [Sorex araneus]
MSGGGARAEGAAHARALSPAPPARGTARARGIAPHTGRGAEAGRWWGRGGGRVASGSGSGSGRAGGGGSRPVSGAAPGVSGPRHRPRPGPRLPSPSRERQRQAGGGRRRRGRAGDTPKSEVTRDAKSSARSRLGGTPGLSSRGGPGSGGRQSAGPPGPPPPLLQVGRAHSAAGSRLAPGRGREIPPAAADVTGASPGLPHGAPLASRTPGPPPSPAGSAPRAGPRTWLVWSARLQGAAGKGEGGGSCGHWDLSLPHPGPSGDQNVLVAGARQAGRDQFPTTYLFHLLRIYKISSPQSGQ